MLPVAADSPRATLVARRIAIPDEAKLNENEDGNAFVGPYVPSSPPDQSFVLNQMLVELQRIRKEVRQLGWLVAIVLAWLVYNTLSH